MFQRYTISNHPDYYEAWPDVALCPDNNRMVCVYIEKTHHAVGTHSIAVCSISDDRGKTWSRSYITPPSDGKGFWYDSPRITLLKNGTLAAVIPTKAAQNEGVSECMKAELWTSADNGETWRYAGPLPGSSIAPDKLRELKNGRLIYSSHYRINDELGQFLYYSDDGGKTWSEEVTIARKKGYQFCEGCIVELENDTLVCLLRENSHLGLPCMKTISRDNGKTWGPVTEFPLPGCHRPIGGILQDGSVLITFRLCQGGKGWLGWWTQNFMGAFTHVESLLGEGYRDCQTKIFPLDYDRSPFSDCGYSGWVQFPDGMIYAVNYIVDNAYDKGQIRGYAFEQGDFLLPERK